MLSKKLVCTKSKCSSVYFIKNIRPTYITRILDYLFHDYPAYYLLFFLIARVFCPKVFGESDFIIVKIVSMNFIKNICNYKERNVENIVKQL